MLFCALCQDVLWGSCAQICRGLLWTKQFMWQAVKSRRHAKHNNNMVGLSWILINIFFVARWWIFYKFKISTLDFTWNLKLLNKFKYFINLKCFAEACKTQQSLLASCGSQDGKIYNISVHSKKRQLNWKKEG